LSPERATLTFDLDVDVCVVGAGLAGLTAAREIARRGWSVAVLEAREVAWNASGCNCGFVLPGFAETIDKIVKRVGRDDARELWALSETGVEYVRQSIANLSMPGVDPIDGWMRISKRPYSERDLELVGLLGAELKAEISVWPAERVREVLQSTHYFQAIEFPRAFHINPLNYARGMAVAAEAAGARIFEHTPALEIDADGVRKRVTTPTGSLRAGHIVLAGNVHLGSVTPEISGTLVPAWTYVVTSAPLGRRLKDAIGYLGGVSDGEFVGNHYRIVGEDRLMWSGGLTTWQADPAKFKHQLRTEIETIYPQLRGIGIDRVWSGALGLPIHRMPQIGRMSPGVWIASGFAGHGINTTAMAGEIIARGMIEGDDRWRHFLPYELVWAGGMAGRAAVQVLYHWNRARERRLARRARDGEQAGWGPRPGEAMLAPVSERADRAE
jgi:gamma-glutamylputrescine oxidase